jgi:hypothetical protein
MSELEHAVMEAQSSDALLLAHGAATPALFDASADMEANVTRMFRDPYQLEKTERGALISELRACIERCPGSSNLRVLLGMALSVDLQAQEAMEVLREAVGMAPDNFVARLKFGELLMRLRICDQAAEHTHEASRLAYNAVQAELARNQAAAIRTMRRNGVERGGFKSLWSRVAHWRVQLTPRGHGRALARSSQ